MESLERKEGTTVVGGNENMTAHEKIVTSQTVEGSQWSGSTQRGGIMDEPETVTTGWTRNWLIVAYTSIIFIHFVNSLQQLASNAWNPFVTSHFSQHGLTAITSVASSIVGGVSKIPLAMFIDVVGRPQGFLVCSICIVMSLVLMATCQNVETYAAAQVFYWTGMNGVHYVLEIFIADNSRLQNRLIWFALTSMPYVANSFIGPYLGQAFLDHSTWRWGFGSFSIITAVTSMATWGMFWFVGRKTRKDSSVKQGKSNRTLSQSVWYWCTEFDVIGLVLACCGFSTLLLPFSLAAKQSRDFASPLIIILIILGVVLLGICVFWEKYGARKSFFPIHLMKDRSVVAACLLGCNSWVAFYAYRNFYSSYLQTVFQLSVAKSGYIINIYTMVSSIWAVIVSFAFKYTDTYKWGGIVAMPVQILMTGLLIHFRWPGTSIAPLIVVEVVAALCAATILQIEQVAIMAAVPHENLAMGLALLFMVTSVGGSIGSAISGALWTQIVPKKIEEYLPLGSKMDAEKLYNSLPEILALPWESLERQAVVRAYCDGQRVMLIFGTCAFLPCLIWVAMLKNYRMSEHTTRKGTQS